MKTHKSLDWLTATQTATSYDGLPPIVPDWCEIGEEIKAPPRFDRAFSLKPAGMVAHSAGDTIVQLVQWTGSEMREIREHGTTDEQMIQHVCTRCNNITRIDYAVDVFETDGSPLDMLEAWKAGTLKTPIRTVQDFRTLTGFKGQTVYFGSKNSAQRIRVYDKAAEQKLLNEAWLRVELQARKKKATPLAHDMNAQGIVACGDTRIRQLLRADSVGWFTEATSGQDANLTEIPRQESRWQKWMNEQVLKSIAAHAVDAQDRAFLHDWLDRAGLAIIDGYKASVTRSDAS